MIDFDFQLDEGVLRDDREMDPGTANAAALQETYFEMPVRLRLDGIEMLEADGITTSPWLPLPLLDVARVAVELIERLPDRGEAIYSLPGGGWSLKLMRRGHSLYVESTVNGRKAVVPYREMKAAAVMFKQRVRSMLRQHVPQLRSHELWGEWIEAMK